MANDIDVTIRKAPAINIELTTVAAGGGGGGGSGDVAGPSSSTDNAVARYNLTSGKIIQNSGVIIDDSNNVTGVVAVTATSVRVSGQTASRVASFDANKDVVSLDTATYPSLTELAYVKGTTSAIQTQLDGKVDENSAITGATKTKITYDAKGLVTSGTDATTADVADSSNRRYVTDAQLTVVTNTSGTNSGNVSLAGTPDYITIAGQTITRGQIDLTTDVTGDLPLANVTQSSAASKLLGRGDSGAGDFQEITLGTNLSMSGTTLNAAGGGGGVSDGDKGDITVSGTGTVWTIDSDAVTYAKIQNVSATDRVLGRSTAGSGNVEEIPCTAAGRALLDDVDNTAQRTTLGLGTLATQSGTFSGTSSGTNSGDVSLTGTPDYITISGQTITRGQIDLTTDVTGDLPLANVAQSSAASKLLGRGDSGAGDFQEITLGTNLSMSGTTLNAAGSGGVADGDKGDITVSGTGTVWTIDNDAVTYAKIQNVSATDRVLGRTTAGAGDIEEIATTGSGNVVRATSPTLVTPVLGTPSSGTLSNCTGLPVSGITSSTSTALGLGSVELGHASDTTLSRSSAGQLAVEGVDVLTTSNSKTLSNKSISGALTLEENASIALDPAGSADGKYTGITITGTAGYTQSFGDLVYLDPTDSRWEAADANSASGADGDSRGILGIVVSTGTDGTACTILLNGVVRADAKFPALTVNSAVYVSETAGSVTQTQPTTADVVIRVVGFALTADEMYFNPSPDYITHT